MKRRISVISNNHYSRTFITLREIDRHNKIGSSPKNITYHIKGGESREFRIALEQCEFAILCANEKY